MGTVKKIPMRKCVGCGEMKNKKEMLRVLKTPENVVVLDDTGRKKRKRRLSLFSERMSGKGRKKQRN